MTADTGVRDELEAGLRLVRHPDFRRAYRRARRRLMHTPGPLCIDGHEYHRRQRARRRRKR